MIFFFIVSESDSISQSVSVIKIIDSNIQFLLFKADMKRLGYNKYDMDWQKEVKKEEEEEEECWVWGNWRTFVFL